MRIIGLKEFLSLSDGTVFMKYSPCNFEGLSVKLQSLDNDFVYQDMATEVESESSGELFDILDDSERNGSSFNLDFDCGSRDGMYDQDQLFAVYEVDDMNGLTKALSKYKEMAYKG